MKLDEYAPTRTPQMRLIAKRRIEPVEKIARGTTEKSVVTLVMIVLVKLSRTDFAITSSTERRFL